MKPVVVAKILQEARILAPLTDFITQWTSTNNKF